MRDIKACIFDLDGTLLDTLSSIWYSQTQSLLKAGLVPPPKENYNYYAGDGARVLVERSLKDSEVDPGAKDKGSIPDPHDPANTEYYYQGFLRELAIYADYEVKPFDGIMDTLLTLKSRGIRLAVLSNKPDMSVQMLIPRHFGSLFDMVLGNRDDYPRKPDPAGALMIASRFGLDPAGIMYLGDTNTDMQTGKNAGMFTVGVSWGFRDLSELEANHADEIVSRPEDILGLI